MLDRGKTGGLVIACVLSNDQAHNTSVRLVDSPASPGPERQIVNPIQKELLDVLLTIQGSLNMWEAKKE